MDCEGRMASRPFSTASALCDGAGPLGAGPLGRGHWGVATIVLQGGGHREPGESVPPPAGSPVAKRALS